MDTATEPIAWRGVDITGNQPSRIVLQHHPTTYGLIRVKDDFSLRQLEHNHVEFGFITAGYMAFCILIPTQLRVETVHDHHVCYPERIPCNTLV